MPKGVYARSKEHLKKLKRQGFQKGHTSWLKGLSIQTNTGRTHFKKGSIHSEGWKKMMSDKFSGENNPAWKGGEKKDKGYIYVYFPNHPASTKKGYVLRSRLVVESKIGRYLRRKEVVHHINEIRDDDREENLMLFGNNTEHLKQTGGRKCKKPSLLTPKR